MNQLEDIFGELGISQYLSVFVEQGFDSWETILDITESDLDALGVKLGHRRKLQRRIANYRGLAPQVSLVSPTQTGVEDVRLEGGRPEPGKPELKPSGAVTKRKYRRHPKPDENAPERPPSAYVLFSNKMRDDLKGRNLSFTEIAKLVGENWQNLNRDEKDPFEKQAHDAKDKYNQELSEYKKTSDYRRYNEYLNDFRKRQTIQTQEKDVSKRLKPDPESTRGSSTSGMSSGAGGTTSGTGSGTESQPGSEPPPSRRQRMGSVASMSDTQFSPGASTVSHKHSIDESSAPSRTMSLDESHSGRNRGLSSPRLRDHSDRRSRFSAWRDAQRGPVDAANGTSTPWLAGMGEGRVPMLAHSPDNTIPSLSPTTSGSNSTSAGSLPPPAAIIGPPSLRTEQSSSGSTSSASSYLPRTPNDASLPIHALLSSKPEPPPPYIAQPHPSMHGTPLSGPLSNHHLARPLGETPPGGINGSSGVAPTPFLPPLPMPRENGGSRVHAVTDQKQPVRVAAAATGSGLDGMSALLRAGEMVDRQAR